MGRETQVMSETQVWSYIMIVTETVVEMEFTFLVEGESPNAGFAMSPGLIIGLATGGTAILFILATIALYIYRHMNLDASDITVGESSDEPSTFGSEDVLSVTGVTLVDGSIASVINKLGATIMDMDEELEGKTDIDDDWLN